MDVTNHLARALIAAHGLEAVAFAERAAANVFLLNMTEKVTEWERVIAAIKEMQAEKKLGALFPMPLARLLALLGMKGQTLIKFGKLAHDPLFNGLNHRVSILANAIRLVPVFLRIGHRRNVTFETVAENYPFEAGFVRADCTVAGFPLGILRR
jgi:hypothetical protein